MRIVHDNLLDALQAAETKGLLDLFTERRYCKRDYLFPNTLRTMYLLSKKAGCGFTGLSMTRNSPFQF